jgi:hypothetical protein
MRSNGCRNHLGASSFVWQSMGWSDFNNDLSQGCWLETLHMASAYALGFLTAWWLQGGQTHMEDGNAKSDCSVNTEEGTWLLATQLRNCITDFCCALLISHNPLRLKSWHTSSFNGRSVKEFTAVLWNFHSTKLTTGQSFSKGSLYDR